MMFDKHTNLKYKFGNRHFWAEGYYVSTVNEATIKIDSRLKELSSKWFFHEYRNSRMSKAWYRTR